MDADITKPDFRSAQTFQNTENYFKNLIGRGFKNVSHASELSASPDGSVIAFTGSSWENLESSPNSKIYLASRKTKDYHVLTQGPGKDKYPRFPPDGKSIVFLSDRAEPGVFQVYLLDLETPATIRALDLVDGSVETVEWAADGRRILSVVNPRGGDRNTVDGSGVTQEKIANLPAWLPVVEGSTFEKPRREIWVYDRETGNTKLSSPSNLNVWEANWVGPSHAIAVVTDEAGEGAWYHARVSLIDLNESSERVLYKPNSRWQPACPVGDPSGRTVSFLEAQSSDRCVVAGNIVVVNLQNGSIEKFELAEMDVTALHWESPDVLAVAGFRGPRSIIGKLDIITKQTKIIWSTELSWGPIYPDLVPLSSEGFVTILEGWSHCPELVVVRGQTLEKIVSFEHSGFSWLKSMIGENRKVSWTASDGLEIQGYVKLPKGNAPHPLVVHVHGGPIYAFSNRWPDTSIESPLVANGYAVFCPNPRGSSGRGQDFAGRVFGDMGGADMNDILSGIDYLVESGLVDANRIGITGGSYGGFMSDWIITKSARFSAAVAVAPCTDWVSQYTTSNIPEFNTLFLDEDDPYVVDGEYRKRSPLVFAGTYPTPVLQVAGQTDNCTPPSQALQYHRALIRKGVKSVLAIYPGEGHRVRKFPAYIDYCARLLWWFQQHMPA